MADDALTRTFQEFGAFLDQNPNATGHEVVAEINRLASSLSVNAGDTRPTILYSGPARDGGESLGYFVRGLDSADYRTIDSTHAGQFVFDPEVRDIVAGKFGLPKRANLPPEARYFNGADSVAGQISKRFAEGTVGDVSFVGPLAKDSGIAASVELRDMLRSDSNVTSINGIPIDELRAQMELNSFDDVFQRLKNNPDQTGARIIVDALKFEAQPGKTAYTVSEIANLKALADGEISAGQHSRILAGETLDINGRKYFAPDLADNLGKVLNKIDGGGTLLVDAASIGLLGFALVESGVIPEGSNFGDVVNIIRDSNIAGAIATNLDSIALDLGQEVFVGAIATALGFGLIWKGKEVLESLDGLREAIRVADEYSESTQIATLNRMIGAAEDNFGSLVGNTAPSVSETANAIAGYVQAGLPVHMQKQFAHAVKGYLAKDGAFDAFSINANDLSNLPRLITIFEERIGSGETFEGELANAISAYPDIKNNPVLHYQILPDHCFAAGTQVRLWGGDEIAIEDVKIGDQVLSFDEDGSARAGTVTHLFKNPTKQWYELLSVTDEPIMTVTPGHRFLSVTGEYVKISDMLRLGGGTATLVASSGEHLDVNARLIEFSAVTAGRFEQVAQQRIAVGCDVADSLGWQTYNFEVAIWHNYVANGVRVHNDSLFAQLTPQEAAGLRGSDVDDETGALKGLSYIDKRTGDAVFLYPKDIDADGNSDKFFEYRFDASSVDPNAPGMQLPANAEFTKTVYTSSAGQLTPEASRFILHGVTNADNAEKILKIKDFESGLLVSAEFFGSVVGTQLGYYFAGDDALARIGLGTAAGVLASNVGEFAEGIANLLLEPEALAQLTTDGQSVSVIGAAWDASFGNFASELAQSILANATGALAGVLVSELSDALGIDGVAGELFESIGTSVGAEFLSESIDVVFEGVDAFDASNLIPNPTSLLASFAARKLAGEIVVAESQEAAILGSIGSAVASKALGSAINGILSLAGGPIGFAIGAFIGQIAGTALGNLFGSDDEPMAGAMISVDRDLGSYALGRTWDGDGGDQAVAAQMAQAAMNGVNQIIELTGGNFRRDFSYDVEIGYDGADYFVNASGEWRNFSNSGEAIKHAALKLLQSADIVGGHAILMRAWHNSEAQTLEEFRDDIMIAEAFQTYLLNPTGVIALMLEQPESEAALQWAYVLQRAEEMELHLPHEKDLDGGWGEVLAARGDINPEAIPEIVGNDIVLADADTGETVTISHVIGPGYEIVRTSGTEGNDTIEVRIDGPSITYTNAGPGDDHFVGHNGADVFIGGPGDDVAIGGDGNDWLNGGTGNDTLEGNAGDDLVLGGPGDDELTGGSGVDEIHGGPGDDTLLGNDHADRLFGGPGDDIVEGNKGRKDFIYGGDGDDTLKAETEDTVFGGAGDDTINLSYSILYLRRNEGHDVLNLADGTNTTIRFDPTIGALELRFLREGADLFISVTGEDQSLRVIDHFSASGTRNLNFQLYSEFSRDQYWHWADYDANSLLGLSEATSQGTIPNTLFTNSATTELVTDNFESRSGATRNFVHGTDAQSFITMGPSQNQNLFAYGGGGDDRLNGGAGVDVIVGGEDDDLITGGGSGDVIYGGADRDDIKGDDGDDRIFGGPGNDDIDGGSGADRIFGGDGNDNISDAHGLNVVRAGSGDDRVIVTGSETNLVYGEDGDDAIIAGEGADRLRAGRGDDLVQAGSGDDYIFGEGGDDQIDAGAGHDVVVGGKGADTLAGGSGADRFVYTSLSDSGLYRTGLVVPARAEQLPENLTFSDTFFSHLQKIAGGGVWNGGAHSAGFTGAAKFTTTALQSNKYIIVGLSDTQGDSGYSSIVYGLYLHADGHLYVYDDGVNRGALGGTYEAGDVLSVERTQSGDVLYSKNGAVIFTSARASDPGETLYADVSIVDVGAGLGDTLLSINDGPALPVQWITDERMATGRFGDDATLDHVDLNGDGVTDAVLRTADGRLATGLASQDGVVEPLVFDIPDATQATLTKISGGNAWNAGVVSANGLSGAGQISTIAAQTDAYVMVGASTVSGPDHFYSINFSIYLHATGQIFIYENGANRGSFGAYEIGDELAIARNAAGEITYLKNGSVFYTSSSHVPNELDLIADAAIWHEDAVIGETVITSDDGSSEPVFWVGNEHVQVGEQTGAARVDYADVNGDGLTDAVISREGADQLLRLGMRDDADRFVFGDPEQTSRNDADVITDFSSGEDVIDLLGLDVSFSDLEISEVGDETHVRLNDEDFMIRITGTGHGLGEDQFLF